MATTTPAKPQKGEGLLFRGRPLMRFGNIISYGSMSDSHIIMMQILETKTVKGLEVASRVSVQLQLTDQNLRSKDRIVKTTEKGGIYSALDIGAIWLERALSAK